MNPHPSDLPLAALDRVTVILGGKEIFSDLSFAVYPGAHLVLGGPNGAGKSTLLSLISGDLRPAQGYPGSIAWGFEGQPDTSVLTAKKHIRLFSPALQRNYVRRGWNISGEEIILSGLDNAAMVYGEAAEHHYSAAAALAEKAGATYLLGQNAPAMSQGQLRLVLLLRALISRPGLLLLDEPYDGLDTEAREKLTACIELAVSRGATVVLAAHRTADIPAFVEQALIISGGSLWPCSVDALPASAPVSCRGLETPFVPLAREKRREVPWPGSARSSAKDEVPVLELGHVDVFIDRKQVLFDINWTVNPGEQWLVTGKNGSGKSTLLRLLYGGEFAAYSGPDTGIIRWFGKPRPSLDELRASVGFVSDRLQDSYDYDISVEDVVISGLGGTIGLYHIPDEEERYRARKWLRLLGLETVRTSSFHSLSTGFARRVLLARALAGAPPVLLLDEPSSSLDAEARVRFLSALPVLAAQGVQIIHATHREQDRIAMFTHELVLQNGRIVFAGKREPAL